MRTSKNKSTVSWFKVGIRGLSFLFLTEVALAQSVPLSFNYQGRAFDTDGTSPLLRTVGIKIQIRSGNGACLLYEEQQNNINLSSSNGYFTINIGSAPGDGKRTSDDPNLSMSRIFSNIGSVRSSSGDCVGGYSPASGDKRRLRVTIMDNGMSVTLSPDQEILSSPYAMVAETLQGVSASGFIQVSGAVTQAAVEELVGKKSELLSLAANESVLSALASGTSNLYLRPSAGGVNLSGAGNISLSAQKSLQLGSYTNAQQSVFISGLTSSDKGKTWFNSDTNMVMYWDGTNSKAVGSATAMTSLNGSTQVAQSLAVGGSGVSPEFVTDASSGVHTLNLPLASTSGVTAGLLSNAEYTALSSRTYVDSKLGGETLPKPTNADDGKALRWNNTSHAWEYYSPLSGAVTSVVASQPLAITGTAAAPQLALSLGTGLSLNGNGELVPDFGTAAGKVVAGDDSRITGALQESQFNTYMAGASGTDACTAGEAMYWNSVSSQFDCASIAIDAAQITTGTIEAARLPEATDSVAGVMIAGEGLNVSNGTVSVAYGSTATTAAKGNDPRLNPAIAGDNSDATKMVRVNAAGTAYELRTPAQVVSDLGLGTASTLDSSTLLAKSGNLSGLADVSAARGNLGITATGESLVTAGSVSAARSALSLGGAAILNVGTTTGTVAAGDDSRITGALSANAFNSAVSPAASCTTAQTAYWNSVSGAFACANISIAGTQIGSGTIAAQRLPAASGSEDGIVTQTAQTLAGVKTFSNDAVFNSKVGVGVASPTEKLEVSGGVKVGNSSSTCNSGAAGTIRWTGTAFQGCDGSSWITLSSGGGSASVKWSELYTGSGDGAPFRISTQTISGWSGVLQVSNNRIAWVESANSTIYFVDIVNGVTPSLAFSQNLSFADGIGGPQVGLLDSSRLVYWSANGGHNLAQVIQIGASSASMGSAYTDGPGMDQYFVKSAFFPTGTANRGLSFFVSCGGGNGTAYTRWVNFSGTTVSSFSPYVSIGSCGSVSQSFIVSESKVLVPFGGSLLLIDVTGTQPTVGTTAVSGASSMSVAQLSSSQYLVHYATSGGGQYLVTATVSGSTVTLGTPLPTTLGGIGYMAGLSSTEAVGTYSAGGVNYFYIADVSNTTPQVTLGPIATGLGNAGVWKVFSIGTGDRFAIAYQNPSDNYPYLKVFKRE